MDILQKMFAILLVELECVLLEISLLSRKRGLNGI